MGKRKKANNVVKVDLGGLGFGKAEVLPVLIQQSSKDGRRVERTVHHVAKPQQDPLPPAFVPSPVIDIMQGVEPSEALDEFDGSGRVRLRPRSLVCFLTRLPLQLDPMDGFRSQRDNLLQEFAFLEGRMGFDNGKCCFCPNPGTFPLFCF